MKLENIFEKKKNPDGTYAGVKFNKESLKAISDYIETNNIPNGLSADKIHSTLLYSRNYLPDYEAQGKIDKPWEGRFKHFSIFPSNPKNGGDGSNCLVMEYSCPEQSERFNELMEKHDATYDFDEYKPHITLSYDVGDLDYKNLPKFEKPLKIVEEYSEDLNLNWADS